MSKISISEFKNNYQKYSALAETEESQVTRNGVLIFTMVPAAKDDLRLLERFFGSLPKEASIGIDPDERG